MNKLSIGASSDACKGLIRPDFQGYSASSQSLCDSKEKPRDLNFENSFSSNEREQTYREKISKRGRFAMIPEEIFCLGWPASRYQIFGLIVGRTETSKPISTRELIAMTNLTESCVRGELAALKAGAFILARPVKSRSAHGVRTFYTWIVNAAIIDLPELGDEPNGRLHGCVDSEVGVTALEPAQGAETSESCQSVVSRNLETHEEQEEEEKKNKDGEGFEGRSHERPALVKSDTPHLPIKPRTETKTKPPREKSGLAKSDLVGMMRCLYNKFTSSKPIEGCIGYLLSRRFDRSVIYDALLCRFERIRPDDEGLSWSPSHLKSWEYACREILQAREPALAQYG